MRWAQLLGGNNDDVAVRVERLAPRLWVVAEIRHDLIACLALVQIGARAMPKLEQRRVRRARKTSGERNMSEEQEPRLPAVGCGAAAARGECEQGTDDDETLHVSIFVSEQAVLKPYTHCLLCRYP